MRAFFDICTIIISTFLLIHSLKRIFISSRYLIYLLFFVFYILPIYLDYLIGFQDHYHYGFTIASADVATACVYDVGLIVASLILLLAKIPNKGLFYENLKQGTSYSYNKSYLFGLILGMFLPSLFAVFLLHQPSLLYTFQWRELELFDVSGSYSNVEKLTYFGISCAVMLLTNTKQPVISLPRLLSLLFLFVNICIQGKRGVLFFAIINVIVNLFLIYISFGKGNKKARALFGISAFVIVALLVGYMIYMSVFVKVGRGYMEDDTSTLYTSTRIDFFREDRVRMAIFAELYPDKMTILEDKCQTIAPTLWSIVPLNYMADALEIPTPSYQQFLSCATEGTRFSHAPKAENPNFMTPTIYAELISNFGIILGFFFFPLLCVWFSKIIDRYAYPLNSFLICTFILLNLFNIPYLMVYAEIVLVLCIVKKRRRTVVRLAR